MTADRSGLSRVGIVPAKTRIPAPTGLVRPRLSSRLVELWNYPATLTVGPAGYGKTTLLAQTAAAARSVDIPVAWYQASASESSNEDLLKHLGHTLRSALQVSASAPAWRTVDEAAECLETWVDRRTLLVIDDLHFLAGTSAEASLERLIGYLPSDVHLLAASRSVPGWNMSRLRLSSMVLEVSAEDLRFRLWEVDRLFREHYGQPLAPEDCAELERRTEGWVGGLALFHLATRGRTSADRHQVLTKLAHRPRLLREYLAHNVLAGLPPELHEFMVRTSVLGMLSPSICDGLLDRVGSEAILREIEKRQLFLTSTDDGETWRFHEVLRSLLESVLVETIGEAATRAERTRAGHLLEACGAWPDALHAYCRAEDWDAVRKLLVDRGPEMVEGELGWLDVLPAAIRAQDPWALLAIARHHVATGRWQSAIESYKSAEAASVGQWLASTCERERLSLTAWFKPHEENLPTTAGAPAWASRLRRGLHRDPLGASGPDEPTAGEPLDVLARGALALAAGRPDVAAPIFSALAIGETDAAGALARIGLAISRWCLGQLGDDEEILFAVEALQCVPVPLVVTLGDAVVRRDLDAIVALLTDVEKVRPRAENPWLFAACQLAFGLAGLARLTGQGGGTLAADAAVRHLRHAAECFASLGCEVLRSWALAFLAAAMCFRSDPAAITEVVQEASRAARLSACPGAHRLALYVLRSLGSDHQANEGGLMSADTFDLGSKLWSEPGPAASILGRAPSAPNRSPLPMAARAPGVLIEMRCFGSFILCVDGRPIDLGAARPKSRSLLRWLAVAGGSPIHRETIIAALWPDDDQPTATRKLHVTVTSLRRLLDGVESQRTRPLVLREGQSYRLDMAADVRVDVVEFARLLSEAETAHGRGEFDSTMEALEAALDQYTGDLLPEEGPAEWVIEARERLRIQAGDAAGRLAELLNDTHASMPRVITCCERGLRIDRYADGLWKRLIASHESSGDLARAARLRSQYSEMLAELGISGPLLPK
jgi:DNA-binding SARP family transcriptional activator